MDVVDAMDAMGANCCAIDVVDANNYGASRYGMGAMDATRFPTWMFLMLCALCYGLYKQYGCYVPCGRHGKFRYPFGASDFMSLHDRFSIDPGCEMWRSEKWVILEAWKRESRGDQSGALRIHSDATGSDRSILPELSASFFSMNSPCAVFTVCTV